MMMRTIDRTVDENGAWAAFERRDRRWDGRVIGAVTTTGIYCRPSCPARRPKRSNMVFYASPQEASAAGYRPCLRCTPDTIARDEAAVAKAVALIGSSEDMLSLSDLAAAVGYAPHHFQRMFTRALGVSPAAYARALRADRATQHLSEDKSVTEAIYDSGYGGASGFYSDNRDRRGMTPSAWKNGGAGETIRWTTFDSPLGPMFLATTRKGICRLTFNDDERSLRRLFPKARIEEDRSGLKALVEGALRAIEQPASAPNLPIDVAGTAFQEKVWQELRKIPLGETRSYSDIAAAIGKPGAVRAVGTANGDNHVSVLIPCHRVIRSDGSLGGYGGGLSNKRKLLAAEGVRIEDEQLPLIE